MLALHMRSLLFYQEGEDSLWLLEKYVRKLTNN